MLLELTAIVSLSLLLAAALTGVIRRLALARGILDTPNERSSHTQATPRGGGVAIVVACTLSLLLLRWRGTVDTPLLLALLGGGIPQAWIGFRDDRRSVSVRLRLLVQLLAAGWAVYILGGLAPLQVGGLLVDLGIAGDLLAVIAIVWAVNLFNFMDGIDGIAASQAIFMAGAGAALAIVAGMSSSIPAAGLVLAAASLGFLVWNWPPARIFMGDVGSGYLGFALAIIGLASMRERAAMLPAWLILGGVFFVDSTVTLLRRLARRERVHEAHRSHAYQWQARRWSSHLRVTIACALLNLLWLGPWAWLSVRFPANSGWFLVAAWAPLIALAVVCGSGRREAGAGSPERAG